MGLFTDWCGKSQSKDKLKHFLTLVEKDGGRDAIRDRLAETMRSHYERLDRIADDVARLGYEGAAELLRTVLPRNASVVSHANGYNRPAAASGGIFKAALPRLTLRTMSLADFVQTNGLGLALLCSM